VEQCVTSDIEIPPYFKEWINIKDIYLNHYNRNVSLATAQPLKQIGPSMDFRVLELRMPATLKYLTDLYFEQKVES
jgi:hypothetical protein